ncbi:MAG: YdeI/OmpD-associated family protein [Bacteroidetes bacterium]|nr:YdeI/OmpD-associated family protein [Bacteroidota bacterium]
MPKLEFTSELFISTMTFHYVVCPDEQVKLIGKKGHIPVTGTVNGFSFSGTLSPVGNKQHGIILRKDYIKPLGFKAGDILNLILEEDLSDRTPPVPAELEETFYFLPDAKIQYETLSLFYKKYWVEHINQGKSEETRAKRIEKLVDFLLNDWAKRKRGRKNT